jgi:wyosine [tRNA(Phe)-imidazoG37] synthetase (radical SAM superfamily)
MKTVYGPVPSWRFGRSLGIDPVCRFKEKVCSFDCIYCQLGRTKHKIIRRRKFVEASRIEKDLKDALKKAKADIITISGSSEPTLASNLGEIIKKIRKTSGLPIAILTNASLLSRKEVRKELSQLDIVAAKLDAPNAEIFKKINRPYKSVSFKRLVEGIMRFRKEYRGKLALQMMFTKENAAYAKEMAELAEKIKPDEVQLNTPLRPSPVKPLSPSEMKKIKKEFRKFNVISVYDAEKVKAKALDLHETEARRPEKR